MARTSMYNQGLGFEPTALYAPVADLHAWLNVHITALDCPVNLLYWRFAVQAEGVMDTSTIH